MTTTNHSERAHAPFGGSVASRRINCTASYQMEEQLPPQPAGVDADEGTEAHECCEHALAQFLYFKVHGEIPEFEIPKSWDKHYSVAAEYTDAVWKNALNESITGKSYVIEKRLVIDEGLGMACITDFAAIHSDSRGRNVGIIGDFKNGFNEVTVEKNDQLLFGACALREEVRRGGHDLEEFKVFIYQPNAGEMPYREWKFSSKTLDTWKKKAMKAAETIFVTKKPKLKAGDWCKWCRAKAICPAYSKVVTVNTQLALVDCTKISLPAVETLPLEHVAKIVLHTKPLEEFIKACNDLARELCENGDGLPGVKLVEGAGKRSISNEDEFVVLLNKKKINPYAQKLISITEATKELKKQKLGDEAIKTLLEPVTTKSSPKILVEESDPRPAVISSKGMLEAIEN